MSYLFALIFSLNYTNIIDVGYAVLRIRQKPLAKIQNHDISFVNKYDGKKITDSFKVYNS